MQMMLQMMQFAFFATFTLKHDSKFNPDYTKNQSRRAPPLPQPKSPQKQSEFSHRPPRPPNYSLRSQTQLSWRLLRRLAFVTCFIVFYMQKTKTCSPKGALVRHKIEKTPSSKAGIYHDPLQQAPVGDWRWGFCESHHPTGGSRVYHMLLHKIF